MPQPSTLGAPTRRPPLAFTLYDTLRRENVELVPRDEARVAIYVCGPTVQDDAHVGHGRSGVAFDVLNRWLRHSGYDVLFVSNITDIDDKIIARAQREGSAAAVVAERYTRGWNRSMDRLGVLAPDVQPRATGHILEIHELIAEMVERDLAYVVDGSVLFRVRNFPDYGRLSGRRLEDALQPDDAIEDLKEHPADFALWKAAKEGEPWWSSPWGPGRPGWHIECSAMAVRHVGAGFDIHGGGVDLVFPHHENEIAQHESVHGAPFARYWMHNGMVELAAAKMSKSIGNVVALADAIDRWGPGPLRLWYASAGYRSPLGFEEARVDEAAAAHGRLTTFLRNAEFAVGATPDTASATSDAGAPYERAFASALDADLNTPGALAALFDLVAAGNDLLGRAEAGDEGATADLGALARTLETLADQVVGLHLRATLDADALVERRVAPLVEDLIRRRADARAARDFAAADAIRDQLTAVGVVVEDRPGGARWHLDRLGEHDRR
ncbi:MAG: cysteine--tRNA ligase [Actinobacteria bacterium]|nr:cysteine--tRNA ligase [Actinomycetota bacterium]